MSMPLHLKELIPFQTLNLENFTSSSDICHKLQGESDSEPTVYCM